MNEPSVRLFQSVYTYRTKCLHFAAKVFALIIQSACTLDTPLLYRGEDALSFTTDSLYCSLGALPASVSDTLLPIPVDLVGRVQYTDRAYRIWVDSAKSTAVRGRHYAFEEEKRKLRAGTVHDTLWVRILRNELDERSTYTLYLSIDASPAFSSRWAELERIAVSFSNRLDMPDWWNRLSYWLGEYDPRKYRKFIEYHGGVVSEKEVNANPYATLRTFKRVRDFYLASPQGGVTFPQVHWEI